LRACINTTDIQAGRGYTLERRRWGARVVMGLQDLGEGGEGGGGQKGQEGAGGGCKLRGEKREVG
jgi:hypothetical protein